MHRRHPFDRWSDSCSGLVGALAYLGRRSQGEPAPAAGVEGIQVSHYTPRGLSRGPANSWSSSPARQSPRSFAKQGRVTAAEKANIKPSLVRGRTRSSPRFRASEARYWPITRWPTTASGSYQLEHDVGLRALRCHRGPLHPVSRTGQRHQRADLGVPTVWSSRTSSGSRRKIAIIDSGIDYTQELPAAGTVATPLNTQPRTPPTRCSRNPPSARERRRSRAIDLVGDSYNAAEAVHS